MDNKVYEKGDRYPFTNATGADIAKNELVHIGNGWCGIAAGAIPDGESGILHLAGVFDNVPKAVATATFAAGYAPAIGTAGNTLAATSSALTTCTNVRVWEDASSAVTTLTVKLNG